MTWVLAGSVTGDRVSVCIESHVEIRIDAHHLSRRVGVAQLDRDAVREPRLEHHAESAGRIGDIGAEGVRVVAAGVVDELIGLRQPASDRLSPVTPAASTGVPPGPEPTALAPVVVSMRETRSSATAPDCRLIAGTSLAIAKLMSVSLSPCLTAPSEKTVKLTTGALVTMTAGTPVGLQHRERRRRVGRRIVGRVGRGRGDRLARLPGGGGGGAVPPPLSLPHPASAGQYEGRRPQPRDRTLHGQLHHFFGAGLRCVLHYDLVPTARYTPSGSPPLVTSSSCSCRGDGDDLLRLGVAHARQRLQFRQAGVVQVNLLDFLGRGLLGRGSRMGRWHWGRLRLRRWRLRGNLSQRRQRQAGQHRSDQEGEYAA